MSPISVFTDWILLLTTPNFLCDARFLGFKLLVNLIPLFIEFGINGNKLFFHLLAVFFELLFELLRNFLILLFELLIDADIVAFINFFSSSNSDCLRVAMVGRQLRFTLRVGFLLVGWILDGYPRRFR